MLVWLGRHLLTKSQSSSFNVVFIYFSPLFSCFLVHERKRQWNYRNYREGGRVENGKHGKHGDSSRKRSPRRSKGESHEISKNTELPAKTLPARLLFPCHRLCHPPVSGGRGPFQVSNSASHPRRYLFLPPLFFQVSKFKGEGIFLNFVVVREAVFLFLLDIKDRVIFIKIDRNISFINIWGVIIQKNIRITKCNN